MSRHSFDPEIAGKVGLNAAVIYQNIRFWCEKNAANGKNINDGRAWTYNSRSAFETLFPYMTPKQIRTALDRLIDEKLLVTGVFNKDARDRTKWYSVPALDGMMQMPLMADTLAPEGQPLPDSKPDIKQDTNVSLVNSRINLSKCFEDFWESYPHRNGKKTKKDAAKAAFIKSIKSGATVEEIAAGVEAMRRDPDVQRGYGRGPVPWLNQRGWTDEIPETNRNGGNYVQKSNHTQEDRMRFLAQVAGVGET